MNGMNAQSPMVERDSRREVRAAGVLMWENKSGPAGALTPVDPGLDRTTCLRGSASRGK